MTGWWLASYVALWVVVALVLVLQVGVLRELGMLRRKNEPETPRRRVTPPIDEDGPGIGSRMPDLTVEILDGGTLSLRAYADGTPALVVCMAPLCEGCQLIVDSLHALLAERPRDLRAVAIMRGNADACRSFMSVFRLQMPVIVDPQGDATRAFNIHSSPCGLLYDDRGALVRQGVIVYREDLAALMGDPTVPEKALANVYPRPQAASSAGAIGAR